jgi:hypothetical protein
MRRAKLPPHLSHLPPVAGKLPARLSHLSHVSHVSDVCRTVDVLGASRYVNYTTHMALRAC